MKEDAKQVTRYLYAKLGKQEFRAFLDAFGKMRITIPVWQDFLDAALDADVREAWKSKGTGTLKAFYQEQGQQLECSPQSIERALKRILRRAA